MKHVDTEKVLEILKRNEWFPYWENWDETMVREYMDYIDWGVLFNFPTYSEDFVREVMQHCRPNDWEQWMKKLSYKTKDNTTVLGTGKYSYDV